MSLRHNENDFILIKRFRSIIKTSLRHNENDFILIKHFRSIIKLLSTYFRGITKA